MHALRLGGDAGERIAPSSPSALISSGRIRGTLAGERIRTAEESHLGVRIG